MILVFLLALLALRGNFYPASTYLKRPLIVTLTRMFELFLDVFYMIYMASLYREDAKLCRFGVNVYLWTGIAGCLFAIVTFPINYLFGVQTGTYSISHRMRGFDNEGGSFGTYLVSVIVLAVAMRRAGWLTRRQYHAAMALFLVCFLGSQAKGAFFALAAVAVYYMFVRQRGPRRWLTAAATCLTFAIVAWATDLPARISLYAIQSARYNELSNIYYGDYNYVMGRVAGAVLAPRMIAAHPWAGIGWGNYPIVRDDPAYRQGSAYALGDLDAPGLGPIDYVVEFGIPLFLYFTWIGFKPMLMMRRINADPALLALAFVQPLSVWAGAHLNLTHPWVVVGFALGIAFRAPERDVLPAQLLPTKILPTQILPTQFDAGSQSLSAIDNAL